MVLGLPTSRTIPEPTSPLLATTSSAAGRAARWLPLLARTGLDFSYGVKFFGRRLS